MPSFDTLAHILRQDPWSSPESMLGDRGAEPAESWEGRLETANRLFEEGAFDAAEAAFRALTKTEPKRLDGYTGVSRCARRHGDHATSLAMFEAAQAIYPQHDGVCLERATDLVALGRQEEAIAAYRDVLGREPAHQYAKRRLADLYCLAAAQAAADGERGRALDLYRRATELHPEQLSAALGLVDALIATGRQDEALSRLEALQATFGPVPEIFARRLNVLRETGRYDEALPLARAATDLHPKSFWLWLERCRSELLLGTDAEIAACLAQMPAGIDAERAMVLRLAGRAHAEEWNLGEAAAAYEAAAALQPDDADIQYDLTRVRVQLLDLPGARRHLKTYHRLALAARPKMSPNVSQTHYGQIVEDYAVDGKLLAALAALQKLPAPERATALAVLVQDHAGSTAAALATMLAWRESGALSRFVPGPAEPGVPPAIVQFWQGGEIPSEIAAATRSWREHNPRHAVTVLDQAEAEVFLEQHFPPAVVAAYRRSREPGQKSDVFRLAWLALRGGIFADVHDRCLAPVEDLVPDSASLAVYQEDFGTLGSNFVAARPNHPVIATSLRLAVTAINRGDADIGWLSTGPALLTRAFVAAEAAGSDHAGLSPGTIVHTRRRLFRSVAVYCATGYMREAD